jgi:hypothetical protein
MTRAAFASRRPAGWPKPYQVRQLLNALWELGLLETE